MLVSLIAMILRSIDDPYDKYPITLTTAQLDIATRFHTALKNQTDFSTFIHLLLESLITGAIPDGDEFSSPIIRFAILLCLRPEGNFVHPSTISPILGKIQWLIRAVTCAAIEFGRIDGRGDSFEYVLIHFL